MIRPVADMVAEATAAVETLPVAEAIALHGQPGVTFVDIRDVRELKREGTIPGALHAPRGMLEFWVDPASPYAKPAFQSGDRFVFFCASAWRSALATKALQDMGLAPVAQIEGGFSAWKAAGGPIDPSSS
ncbi:rhodanese-like domain-containing protein [Roseobacter sp. HKCCA0434]|uniref:rhodanese-like domain-containing protein n=1 Tax=Roseobacter sp. HKCCA0434 TaxID=3079297 RepID=UPI00290586B3|nr:rhodanese-like domain-containing protein [Roseobacter sp. HKCCA0434]